MHPRPASRRIALGCLLIMMIVTASACSDGGEKTRAKPREPKVSKTAPDTASPSTTQLPSTGVITAGSRGSFEFTEYAPLEERPIMVWFDAPDDLTSAKVLVVMHGQQRNGEQYRDEWAPYTRDHGVLLIVPEFSEEFYPGPEGYNQGNVVTPDGETVPEAAWSFSAIEPLFDYVRAATGNQSTGYALFGHSAGAQFVHRFMLLKPDNRVTHAVSANAGWYTATETAVEFPYGLRASPSTEAGLKRALGAPLTILLGENDTETESDSLRSTPEADRQGPNRLARGHFFFETGRKKAAALGTSFGWDLQTVPGAEHSNIEMAPAAAAILLR